MFKNNTNIVGVSLGVFVTEIPDSAFEGCTSLKEVLCPSVTKIGNNAFKGCTSLSSFKVPDDVTELGTNAFEGVPQIKSTAFNAEVANAIANSGAERITLDISNIPNNQKNNLTFDIGNIEYFELQGKEKEYKALRVVSTAEETVINGIKTTECAFIPFVISSEEVTLDRVNVESSDYALILDAETTNLKVNGTVTLTSSKGDTVFCRNLTLAELSHEEIGRLKVSGNLIVCGNINGEAYLSVINGAVIQVENQEFVPVGTAVYNGHYYQLFNENLPWEYAKEYCNINGGHLVTIMDENEQNAVMSLINNYNNDTENFNCYWMDGNDFNEANTPNWITGEPMTYTNWASGNPGGGKEHWMDINAITGEWYDYYDTFPTIGFICEYDSISPTETIEYNGHCYEIYNVTLSWEDAKNYCDSIGGHLVTITDEDEQNAVMSLISNNNYEVSNINCYWMGGNDFNEANTPSWITGEPMTYTNWANGNPGGGREHWMDINAITGEWYDYIDTYPTIGFICEYEQSIN